MATIGWNSRQQVAQVQHPATTQQRSSALNTMRLIAAYTVLYSHSYALVGLPQPQVAPGVDLGTFAVFGFFVISGYLVWISWERSPSAMSYVANRVLRIYPGLIAAVLFCALILGPIVTRVPLGEYFTGGDFLLFIRHNLAPWGYWERLPGVFEQNTLIGVNGPLWTISYELLMYGLVFAVGIVGGWRFRVPLAWVLFVALAIGYLLVGFDERVSVAQHAEKFGVLGFRLKETTTLGSFFWAAALFAIYRQRIPMNGLIAAGSALALLLSSGSPIFVPIAWFALPYVVLYVAFSPVMLSRKESGLDYSYGTYLYAWPVAQTVTMLGFGAESWAANLALTTVITLSLAALSWHLIERPGLRMKRRFAQPRGPVAPERTAL